MWLVWIVVVFSGVCSCWKWWLWWWGGGGCCDYIPFVSLTRHIVPHYEGWSLVVQYMYHHTLFAPCVGLAAHTNYLGTVSCNHLGMVVGVVHLC